jgi:hypothetical protein
MENVYVTQAGLEKTVHDFQVHAHHDVVVAMDLPTVNVSFVPKMLSEILVEFVSALRNGLEMTVVIGQAYVIILVRHVQDLDLMNVRSVLHMQLEIVLESVDVLTSGVEMDVQHMKDIAIISV